MKKSVRTIVLLSVVAVSTLPSFAAVSGGMPRPQAVSGGMPRPQIDSMSVLSAAIAGALAYVGF